MSAITQGFTITAKKAVLDDDGIQIMDLLDLVEREVEKRYGTKGVLKMYGEGVSREFLEVTRVTIEIKVHDE
jgi:hypothetical protein